MTAEENKRLLALSCIIADLKAENVELAQRVHQLMDDYNENVHQLRGLEKRKDEDQSKQTLGEMNEMRDLCDKLESENEQLKSYVTAIDSLIEEKGFYMPKGKSCVYVQGHPAAGSQSCLECTSCLRILDGRGVVCQWMIEDI